LNVFISSIDITGRVNQIADVITGLLINPTITAGATNYGYGYAVNIDPTFSGTFNGGGAIPLRVKNTGGSAIIRLSSNGYQDYDLVTGAVLSGDTGDFEIYGGAASGYGFSIRPNTAAGRVFTINKDGLVAVGANGVATANTRLDIRGIGTTTNLIQRWADSSNTVRASIADAGNFDLSNQSTTTGFTVWSGAKTGMSAQSFVTATNAGFIATNGSGNVSLITNSGTARITTSMLELSVYIPNTGSLIIRRNSVQQFAHDASGGYSLQTGTGVVASANNASSTATQAGSTYLLWSGTFWTGSAESKRGFFSATVASTASNLVGRLAFYENITSGSGVEIMNLSNSGNLNAALVSGSNVTIGGGATASELRFLEPSGGGTSYIAFKAPAMAGNTTYDLPDAYPAVSGYVLSSTTAGVMSWVAAGGGGGATLTGSTNEIIKYSSSTSGIGSKVFSAADGNLTLGDTGLTGANRVFTADGSATDVGFTFTVKGSGTLQTPAIIDLGTSSISGDRTLQALSSSADSTIAIIPKGSGSLQIIANDIFFGNNSFAGSTRALRVAGSATDVDLYLYAKGAGALYLGTNRVSTLYTSAATNDMVETVSFERQSTGTTAAGFGIQHGIRLENASNAVGSFIQWKYGFTAATNAAETTFAELVTYNAGTPTTNFKVDGNKIGFFAATPVVKQSAVTTAQGIADALTAYGLLPTSTVTGGSGVSLGLSVAMNMGYAMV